jgi:ketosteroid isomerase-like protein
LAAAACAAAGSTEDQVKEAEKAWIAATTKNDFAALEKILAEELIYTHSSGVSDSKREFIDNLKKGVRKYESLDYESSTVKVLGNTAILTGKGRLKVTTNGQTNDMKISLLHVYLKRGSGWQLVGHQSARLQ